ncbi:MAG TPA: MipA/OmpV family protein [Chloroflexota bacterium]|nr:MipA/OmpV family protein [Chloroflexota bacterium]
MLLLACATACADDTAPPPPPASLPASAPAAATRWEGAIGPQFGLSPEYQGASRRHLSVTLGFYLRYGRLSISNSGGFVTRRADDVFRGLGLDLVRSDRVRVNFALRLDNGRRSAVSDKLAGIHNVRRTIRVRSSATWQLAEGWKVAAGWNADLLGRGGGNVVDLGVGHDRRLTQRTIWNVGAGLNWADGRYLRSYYGVTPEEAAVTGYPVYTPGSGLRDVSVGTGFRTEINERWMALWGGSIGRVMGPAAASPLTTSTAQWSLNAAVAWRF